MKLDEKEGEKERREKGEERRTRSSRSDVRSLIAAWNRKRLLFKRTMKRGGKGGKGDERKGNDLNQCARKYREKREREIKPWKIIVSRCSRC